jgi:pyruvate dehydrogenase E2 component (dihydrolipoamide acetyltransferase)
VEIVMPRLSDSMEEGTILAWLVAEGERIEAGQPLAEIETDKASVTYEADAPGVIVSLRAGEGQTVPVGAPIAVLGVPGKIPAVRPKASPLARRLAAEHNVDLASLAGSGPQGRIVRADVESAATDAEPAPDIPPAEPAPDIPPAAPAGNGQPVSAKGDALIRELTRGQQTVARRMAESRATVPDIELRVEVDMTAAVALRERLAEVADPAPSYNDFIVRAAALALRAFPNVNGAYRDAKLETYSRVNVGIAVAADGALVVPTIFDADRRSLSEISREARRLAARVREGSISPDEVSGATFTVSNLGMHGVDSFSAVINPPQAAILAAGALRRRPLVDEATGELAARPTILLALACDHRIVYGVDGARFVGRVRELLQRPHALLL